MVFRKLLGISFLSLSMNATAAEGGFPQHGEAKSKYHDYELIDAAAKGRAVEFASQHCTDGALQESDWEIRRWSSWERPRPCSPNEDECPIELMYNTRATALFRCR